MKTSLYIFRVIIEPDDPKGYHGFVPLLQGVHTAGKTILKARELIRVLGKLGFFKHHQVESHAQFKHIDGRRVTVPIHAGRDIGRKTLKGIIADLKMNVDDFIKLLRK